MSLKSQTIPVIRTKLYAPSITAGYESRGRLIEMMDAALEMPLALISAPAGYGKTVLVSEWVRHLKQPSAWLSLDEADGDLWQFLTYFVAAIDAAYPGACQTTPGFLAAPELPPLSVVASYLINYLDDIDGSCVIVLDDYHLLDPPLPLAKLRAANRITEVRLRDLQFTGQETAHLVAATMGHDISAEALVNLQSEVEGWAAALRLTFLAVRHSANPDASLRALHGGVPQTQQYLLAEVLDGLPTEFRDCLLKSSILK